MKRIFNRQGMALVSILLVLLIIGAVYYLIIRKNKKTLDPTNKSFVEGAGIDTSSYVGILDSSKKVIKNAQSTRGE